MKNKAHPENTPLDVEENVSCSPSPEAQPAQAPPDPSRREFLCGLAALSLAGLAGCASTPPSMTGQGASVPAGTAQNPLAARAITSNMFSVPGGGKLANGQALVFMMPGSGEPGVILRSNAGEMRALSAKCTHVGCTVAWEASQSRLRCPCHSSNFDANGKVLGGPAKKDLQQFKVSTQGDDAIVTL